MPKQVVRVEPTKASKDGKPSWTPTPEAKQKATTNRIIAAIEEGAGEFRLPWHRAAT